MVTFTALVVETDNPYSSPTEIEPIFVVVKASKHRRRQSPDRHLDDRTVTKNTLLMKLLFSLHVGMIANNVQLVK